MSEQSNGHALIGRDFNFAARRKTIEIYIPELEKTFRLRALKTGQGLELPRDTVRLLALMIVDANNQLIFTSEEDIQNLSEMDINIGLRLIQAAQDLNGISKEAQEAMLKNSNASLSADSSGA